MQITEQSARQNLGIEPAPHVHSKMSTQKLMVRLMLSLLPALAVMTYFFGAGTLVQFALTASCALCCQVFVAFLRGRSMKVAAKDPSGLVTALLLAMTLPPLLPWYYTVVATLFAMIIVRECFGGLGMNLFNPAMAGFIFLVVSTPGIFYNTWVSPAPEAIFVATPERVVEVIFEGHSPDELTEEIKALNEKNNVSNDALSGATFLESTKTARKAGTVDQHAPLDFTQDAYLAYLCLGIAYTFGGLVLIFMHVIRFQMPLTFIITILAVGALWHYCEPELSINALEHLFTGGTMLAAFYIITDPVTTCGSFKGRIVFAFFIAILVILIRVHGSYSDSVAFAVLLGNCVAPLIDVMTRRRPFGIGYRQGGLD